MAEASNEPEGACGGTFTQKRVSRRQFLYGASAVAATLGAPGILTGCSSNGGGGGESGSSALRFGLSSFPDNLDPFQDRGTSQLTVSLAMHRGLLGYKPDGTLRPELAENWSQDDERTYTFTMRKNAKFHDGTRVTAGDVQASLEHIQNPKSSAKLQAPISNIAKISTPSDHTVQIRLKNVDAVFLFYMADPHAPVVPKKTLSTSLQKELGAGPFVFKSKQRGRKITASRFDSYYENGLPNASTLELIGYTDSSLRVQAVQAGDVDIIEYVPYESISQLEGANLKVETTDGPFMYVNFNGRSGPFSDPMVRLAVAYAVDRTAVLKSALFGQGSVLKGFPIPKSSKFFNKGLSDHWGRDLDRARTLLRQAGHPNGFKATMLSTSQYSYHQDTAVAVQTSLRDIGIDLKLDLPDWATHINKGDKGDYDIAVNGSAGAFNDPASLERFLTGPESYTRSFGLRDPQIGALMEKAKRTTDLKARKDYYEQVQHRYYKVVPFVGLAWRSQAYAMQGTVEGFHNLPGFLTYNSGYSFSTAHVA